MLLAKKECFPQNIKVKENLSQVDLQDLLDHTAERILKSKPLSEIRDMPNDLKLISKWGCDGSSGHSEYQQKFTDENTTDKSMFFILVIKKINLYIFNFSLITIKISKKNYAFEKYNQVLN